MAKLTVLERRIERYREYRNRKANKELLKTQVNAAEREEKVLWKKYKKTKNKKLRDFFFNKYYPLIIYQAKKINPKMHDRSIEFGDLIQYGCFGLMDAIKKYDLKRNVKFITYAFKRVYGSIMDELRKNVYWIPRCEKKKRKEKNWLYDKQEDVYQDEIMLSLDKIAEEKGERIEDKIKSCMLTPEEEYVKKEIVYFIINAIRQLNKQQRIVLKHYYFDDYIMKDIGKRMKLGEGRISQIHTTALIRICDNLKDRKLPPFVYLTNDKDKKKKYASSAVTLCTNVLENEKSL